MVSSKFKTEKCLSINELFVLRELNTLETYNSDEIRVLEGLKIIREKPQLFLGKSVDDPSILCELIQCTLCHALDLYVVGKCTKINITINHRKILIEYNGGMYLEKQHDFDRTAEEILCLGYSFNPVEYFPSVGDKYSTRNMSIVIALSSKFSLATAIDGQIGKQVYKKGEPATNFTIENWSGLDHTNIAFELDSDIFCQDKYSLDELVQWCSELQNDFEGLSISLDI